MALRPPFNNRVWNYLSSTLQEFADVLSAYLPAPTPPEPPYKVYSVLLTQSGIGNPPTAIVLENTLGLNPTYYYNGPGSYYLEDLAGLFTTNKTFVTAGITLAGNGLVTAYVNSTSNIEFNSYSLGTAATIDGWLDNTPIEIRVYN